MQSRKKSTKLALAGVVLAFGSLAAQAQTTPAVDPANQPPTAAGVGMNPADMFTKADANRDGKLSRDETKTMPAVADKFDTLDKDKDGSLSMSEFSAGVKASPK